MKDIIYRTNPLIENNKPDMPYLAIDGTECYSLEEVDLINRDILASSTIKNITEKRNQIDLEELYSFLVTYNVKFVEFRIIFEAYVSAKKSGILPREFQKDFEQALLTANIICITEQEVEALNILKSKVSPEELEPTSGGRK